MEGLVTREHNTHALVHHTHTHTLRWHVIHKSGPFSRSGGLQAGVDYVTVRIVIIFSIPSIELALVNDTGYSHDTLTLVYRILRVL